MDNIVLTFLGAFVWAIFGYLSRQPEEAFEPKKLFSTFLAGVVVAILTVTWAIPSETGETFFVIFLARTGGVIFIERLLKAVWRRWLKKYFDWIDEENDE